MKKAKPVLLPYCFDPCSDDETVAIENEAGEHVCIIQIDVEAGDDWKDAETERSSLQHGVG